MHTTMHLMWFNNEHCVKSILNVKLPSLHIRSLLSFNALFSYVYCTICCQVIMVGWGFSKPMKVFLHLFYLQTVNFICCSHKRSRSHFITTLSPCWHWNLNNCWAWAGSLKLNQTSNKPTSYTEFLFTLLRRQLPKGNCFNWIGNYSIWLRIYDFNAPCTRHMPQ